jgi:hypothetical protein
MATVATQILDQLGKFRFLSMTGSKNLIDTNDGLRMDLVQNQSGCNRLHITLEADDTYRMYFYRMVIDRKTFDVKLSKEQTFEGVYADNLQSIFTKVTGLDTHL